jgi:hypothetical protein
MRRALVLGGAFLTVMSIAGCGGSSGSGDGDTAGNGNGGGNGSGAATGNGGGDNGSGAATGSGVIFGGGDGSAGSAADGGSGTSCNALRIATIGRLGPWGTSTLFTAWLEKEGTQPAVDLGDTVLTPDVLQKYDVIVALNLAQFPIPDSNPPDPGTSHAYSDPEASALEAWLRAGGGIMTTIGYTSDEANEQANVDKLLAFAEVGYSTTLLDADGDETQFDPHPTTNNVHKLSIQNGVRPAGSGGTVIGWDTSNREALIVSTVDSGRIVVWGDEWITYDEYWGSRPDLDIEVFWVNVMNWLAPTTACKLPILR